VHVFEIEEELVLPILKGSASITRLGIVPPTIAAIIPNHTVHRIESETTFASRYPLAHAHFTWVEKETHGALSSRSTYRRMLATTHAPFFSIYNVGRYTFAPHKVVWAEISRTFVAGIASSCPIIPSGPAKVIVPDHKVYFAAFDELEPAMFLCALLNGAVVRSTIDAITEKLQVGALLDRVCLPPFDASNTLHQTLVSLALECGSRRWDLAADRARSERMDEVVLRVLGEMEEQAHQVNRSTWMVKSPASSG